jgi:hypothetical protein
MSFLLIVNIWLTFQLRDTINLCNTELIMTNAISTDSSNRAILDIAKHTARETQTMKTLTIIALVFVPASFAAVGARKI